MTLDDDQSKTQQGLHTVYKDLTIVSFFCAVSHWSKEQYVIYSPSRLGQNQQVGTIVDKFEHLLPKKTLCTLSKNTYTTMYS